MSVWSLQPETNEHTGALHEQRLKLEALIYKVQEECRIDASMQLSLVKHHSPEFEIQIQLLCLRFRRWSRSR